MNANATKQQVRKMQGTSAQGQPITCNVRRLSETDEWKVTVSISGKWHEGPAYYTNDEQDALNTLPAVFAGACKRY